MPGRPIMKANNDKLDELRRGSVVRSISSRLAQPMPWLRPSVLASDRSILVAEKRRRAGWSVTTLHASSGLNYLLAEETSIDC